MLYTGESGDDVSLAGVQLVANDCLSMGRRLILFWGVQWSGRGTVNSSAFWLDYIKKYPM